MASPIVGLLEDFRIQDKHSFKGNRSLFALRNPFSPIFDNVSLPRNAIALPVTAARASASSCNCFNWSLLGYTGFLPSSVAAFYVETKLTSARALKYREELS
jgi:hypothetical protein